MEGLRSGAPPFAPARLGSARGGSASRPAPVPLPALRPRPRGEAERGARSIAREEEEEGGGKSEKKPCPDPAGGERKVAAASRSAVAAQRGFRDPRPAAWTPGPQDGSQRRASPREGAPRPARIPPDAQRPGPVGSACAGHWVYSSWTLCFTLCFLPSNHAVAERICWNKSTARSSLSSHPPAGTA